MSRARPVAKPGEKYAAVQSTPDAKHALSDWIFNHRLKPTQGRVVGSLIRWFLRQEDLVQTAVLSDVDQGMEHAYADALRRLASELAPDHRPAIEVLHPHGQTKADSSLTKPKKLTQLKPEETHQSG